MPGETLGTSAAFAPGLLPGEDQPDSSPELSSDSENAPAAESPPDALPTSGSPTADEILEAFHELLPGLIPRFAGLLGAEEAEGVAQSVYETALAIRDKYDPSRGDLQAWLLGIARKTGQARARQLRRSRMKEVPVPDQLDDGAEAMIEAVETELLAGEVLNTLSSKNRQIIELRFLEDLSHREIAAIVGSTENAVRLRVMRSLMGLRSWLLDEAEAAGNDQFSP